MREIFAAALLSLASPAGGAQTVVSLNFDDNTAGQQTAAQILSQHGMKGTFFVNSGRIGTSGYLNLSDLLAIQADGHEVTGHTVNHLDLTTLSLSDQQHQICDDRAQLLAWGFSPVADFAYPFGSYNSQVQGVAKSCGYKSGRTVGGISCGGCPAAETIPPGDAYGMMTPDSIKSYTTLATMESYVTNAENAGGGWVILVMHHICDGCDTYSVSPAILTSFTTWLQGRSGMGTVVKTMGEVMGVGGPPPNPVPGISSISPNSATAGGPGFTLTVNGSNFIPGSAVQWNGSARSTSFVGASRVTASIPSGDIAVPGTANVTVFNPGPGGGVSNAAAFAVNGSTPAGNPVPAIASISPNSAAAGGQAFTLTVDGSNFIPASAVRWNGAPRATSFVGASRVTASIPSGDISSSGTANVTVFNPAPGGGTSNAAAFAVNGSTPSGGALFADSFNVPDGLITNEYAFWNPADPNGFASSSWAMTSGSLFASGGQAWTGVPDDVSPNAASSNGTDSADFELATKRRDFGNVAVSFTLINQGLTSTPSTPPQGWDGVHAVLRYQGEGAYYYFDANRRDNLAAIKKKSGASDVFLSPEVPYAPPFNSPQTVRASVFNNSNGSVSLSLSVNGQTLVSATDTGTGGAPLTAAGGVGIRGLNDNFKFGGFTVSAISALSVLGVPRAAAASPAQVRVFPNPWRADRDQGYLVSFDGIFPGSVVKIYSVSGRLVRSLASGGGAGVWDANNDGGRPVASGVYIYVATDRQGRTARGKIAIIR